MNKPSITIQFDPATLKPVQVYYHAETDQETEELKILVNQMLEALKESKP